MNRRDVTISQITGVWVAPQEPGTDTQVPAVTVWELWENEKTPLQGWSFAAPPKCR